MCHAWIPYLSTKLQDASHLDIVLDTYTEDSLKGMARTKRGKGVLRRAVAAAAIPGNWQSFFRMDDNKMELFRFLPETTLKWFDEKDKQLVITDGEGVLSKPPLEDLASLFPCSDEESDSRMLLHALHSCTEWSPQDPDLDI